MKIALIAHDNKKDELVDFVRRHRDTFEQHQLIATGTTGQRIQEEVGIEVHRLLSGPLGGDQQIGSQIASGEVAAVFFFRDPLTPHPHEPDVSALLRLCDVTRTPIATNVASARVLVRAIAEGWLREE